MWLRLEILNVWNTLTLKSVFWKTETFFKDYWVLFFSWEYYNRELNISIQSYPVKSQTECEAQNVFITKNGVLPLSNLFFEN